MEIQTTNDYCVITPLSPRIDKRETERILDEIRNYSSLKIGFNLDFVNDCTIDFLEVIQNIGASIFNIQSDIFSLILAMNIDKKAEIYATEEDFLLGKRQLLNREFRIV